jgi:very-short-patch-repair endonuclease
VWGLVSQLEVAATSPSDREKDLFYRDAGFDVLRFTRAHVVYKPAMVLVRLVRALERRAPIET